MSALIDYRQFRKRAATSLIEYARFIDIPGVPQEGTDPNNISDHDYKVVETPLAAHHLLMLNALQDLIDNNLKYNHETLLADTSGKACKRLMLLLPPGAAKSTYASVVFPTFVMGSRPHTEVILTGHGGDITKRHGKRARQICASTGYTAVFGATIDPNTRAAENWQIESGSSYKAAGILAGITGFRTSLLICDDLVKGRKSADSVVIRNDTYNAYVDDARSRKTPPAHELMINTRWHEDDVSGRILPEGYAGESGFIDCRDGNVWYVMCIPAQCERDDDLLGRKVGDYLWSDWFDDDYWNDKKVNPRSWNSLYQQRPSPDTGLYFQKDWFRTYRNEPKVLNKYISFDPAVTESEDADSTAIQLWGVDTNARLYLLDEWVNKVTMDVWIDLLMTWIAIHKPMAVISESGVIRRAAEPYIKRSMQQTGHFAMFEWMSRNADKSAMARPAQAMVAAGQVYLPENSIGDNTIDELLRFPAAKDDHRVDAFANLCLYLEQLWASNPPTKKKDDGGTLEHGFSIKQIMPSRHPKRKSRWD